MKLPEMVYNGPDMLSRTHGQPYRIRSVTHVGVKTVYEFYDNQSRLKHSEYFISEDKYCKQAANFARNIKILLR